MSELKIHPIDWQLAWSRLAPVVSAAYAHLENGNHAAVTYHLKKAAMIVERSTVALCERVPDEVEG